MAATLPSLLTLLLFILFTTKSHAFISTNISNSLDNFVQCYQALTHFSASHTVHTNTSSLYNTILFSSAQNLRFIVAATPVSKPAIIVTPDEEAQVAVTVQCAYTYDVQLRVRSGGHDAEGTSYVVLPDNTTASAFVPFVDVDLGRLRRIDVDAGHRTAWVQAGATMGEVYYGVFTGTGGAAGFPGGTGRTVGVGGHIGAGGGMGPMMRRFGLAADNVVDARVVGTCGRVLDREGMGEEMFWAIRGGGAASFGIVVAYKLKLVDVPRRNQVSTFTTTRTVLEGANLNAATVNLLTE